MRTNELILYRYMEHEDLLRDMTFLIDNADNDYYNKEDLKSLLFENLNELIELAANYGFEGNLWHTFLTFLLANSENAYSTACEVVGEVEGSVNKAALHDFQIFKELFEYDLKEMGEKIGTDSLELIADYHPVSAKGHVFNKRIRDRICDLSKALAKADDAEEFKATVTQFYKEFGVGTFGLHKAFRIEHTEEGTQIVPITKIAHVHLDDLVGYDIAKKKLVDNTEAFVKGKKANNCLLFGDAGTGKSSSIKAILNQYYDQGLRMIEVYKHQFKDLNDVIAQIKNRNYKFIIYMDDLSFEEFEIEYKYLKAVIEGGLEKKPDNILIYATSNRRHLVRETFKDKADRDEELHTNDTVQEKLSLVARFGVTIYFGKPDKKEFQKIVTTLADRYGVEMEEEKLLLEANKWELSHGGLSGRTAQQFIDYLLGQQ
ncbi:ATP-binding protein [Coprococcus comes]|uniref:ATP-binding protein n=1 Tax=Coprococcus comes TaxID=410072 RepID=A0A3R6AJY9_9FIRM|nr:ATP-binding protein [Coprococcus comes]RGU47202.1 ATP-binding protein [Coprococcus comes]RHG62917.1 ATP-binding protein [Coprococcus comes]